VVDLIEELEPETVRANLKRIREEISAAGRDPDTVEILAAIKYLPAEHLPALAAGGIKVVGENRAQDLIAKQDAYGELFEHWDFIGALQSRKVKDLVGRVRYIESLGSESALAQLGRHGGGGDGVHGPRTEVLIEVNVAREEGKGGIAPEQLGHFIEACPVPVVGLMTMPPKADRPGDSRPHFAALRELAEHHQLRELSMGTSQDYRVAVEEGATIIRLGSVLYRFPAP
jgi:PLP dependent protein